MSQLTIVVPVLNEDLRLGVLLADIQTSGLGDVEVIVVDGGSGDNTVTVAEKGAARVLQALPGRARQMNAGLQAVTTEWVWFLHADTRVSADVVKGLLVSIDDESVDWGRFDVVISGRSRLFPVIAWFMNRRSCITGIATGDQGIFVRTELCRQIGGIPDLVLMEDIELSKQFKRICRPACLPYCLETSGRRWESGGVVRTIMLMWWIRLAWFLGVDDKVLNRWYR